MEKIYLAKFISAGAPYGDVCPVFKKEFSADKKVKSAVLSVSSFGVYEAYINNNKVGNFYMAPGWTSYNKRLQYQKYDVTSYVKDNNVIEISAGEGWAVGGLVWDRKRKLWADEVSVIAVLELTYEDGSKDAIYTDETWLSAKGPVLFSDIYDGEKYDSRIEAKDFIPVSLADKTTDMLIAHEGEIVCETERVKAVKLIVTPKGETVIDFGQNLTGYVEFQVNAPAGEIVEYDHAEVLDKDGNFYTDNLRGAKEHIEYICNGKESIYHPHFTFQGFRYIRINKFPGEINIGDFTAVVVHSDMKRTGYFECSNEKVNKLFSNIIWGQRGNFLDVPTDCPQRDERLGWTGDAQIFCKTAAYNYDVEKFFVKWLRDLAADQLDNGSIPAIIPDVFRVRNAGSAAWGDASVICPWQIYLSYNNKKVLEEQFDSMKAWVEFMHDSGPEEFLWLEGEHYGDWLGLDAPEGSYKGSTDEDLIATAFFAYSTSILIKAGKVLGKDMTEYEKLYDNVVAAFRKTYIDENGNLTSDTQTAHVLVLKFDLVEDKARYAKKLADMVTANGNKIQTGFVGTPYIMDALSENGYHEIAYSLLLQEEFPSWLFSVNMGATTIWEHWDGMKADGSMWSVDMNSFNHYAYGAVASWMYGVMAGICADENNPGYKHFFLKPVCDKRIDYVKSSYESRYGVIKSEWKRMADGAVEYKFSVPCGSSATLELDGKTYELEAGEHTYTV